MCPKAPSKQASVPSPTPEILELIIRGEGGEIERSVPEFLPEKNRSLPVSTRHRMELSASISRTALPISLMSSGQRALRAFGLFIWIRPTSEFLPFRETISFS